MITATTLIFTLTILSAYGYHDPDLNYHLSQVQKLQGCDDGYSYPAPAVQLTTTGVKVAAPTLYTQPAYQYSNAGYSNAGYSNAGYTSAGYSNAGFSTGVAYASPVPQNTYLPQAPTAYQGPSYATQSNYATATKEVHGYKTSAGLSSVASPTRTVIPQATYAQAPIIAKVTAAPLIAKFAVSPARTTFVSQNIGHAAGSARASLSTFGGIQTGGPVVSQVYAAPSATYATSSALKVQSPQMFTPMQYTSNVVPAPTLYNQAQPQAPVAPVAPAVTQYATSSVSQSVNTASAASASQYFSPAVPQYTQYAAPSPYPSQVQVPQVSPIYQYTSPVRQFTPAVAQYSYSNFAGAGAAQYNAANIRVTQHAPIVTHVPAPVTAQVAVPAPVPQIAHSPAAFVKNVHTDFLENYNAHPRYAYEYSVNDPHTGDIKQQKEERDGEVVKGQYSLVEPDGSVRTVDYVADWETGFHADVRNSKDSQH